MIPLKDKVNVNPPSVPYPFGELRDNPGDNTGTPVDNQLMNDVMQLMEVWMASANITPNGLLENDTNGFQLYQAFRACVRIVFAGYTSYGVSQVANQTVTNAGTSELHHVTPKGLNDRAASEILTGILAIATQAKVNAGVDDSDAITSLKLKESITVMGVDGSVKLRTKIVDIGDWNMFSNATKNVSHGVSDFKKIHSISVIIRDDTDAIYSELIQFHSVTISGTPVVVNYGGYASPITGTDITLNRVASGFYGASYATATSFNRGSITIVYEA